ncbi:MAG TPA: TIGR03936 family radical SAM-associated protein, partial [Candidatus Acidoferrales bacterium]|nr:TIGR03936 family radical SAM-associated protein [Candidatus Acidoferrales bacterium]
ELAYAFERTLTPDCSVERCTYCGACDFTTIRNVDYHVRGAKGSEHRGSAVDHWASDIVAEAEEPGAWEPRGWHKIQAKKQGKHGPQAPAPSTSPDPQRPARHESATPGNEPASGLGNAEEWLSAGGEALAPVVDTKSTAGLARVRLTYTKLGLARFIGSLELTTLFHRAARRAGLPIAFSQGYHPLPRFAFGPGLPVGVESDGEFVDLDLTELLSAEAVRERLDGQFPEGIRIIAAHSVPLRGQSIGAQIAAFRYRIDVQHLINGDGGAHFRERIVAFRAASEFPLTKHAKGTHRIINARPFVAALQMNDLGIIDTTILFGSTGTLKPMDLLGTVLGLDAQDARALPVHKIDTICHGDAHPAAAAASPIA